VRVNNKVGLLERGSTPTPGLFNFRENIWGTVRFYIPAPSDIQEADTVALSIWNIGKKPMYVSELCLSVCK
jgi:hypothetical protein